MKKGGIKLVLLFFISSILFATSMDNFKYYQYKQSVDKWPKPWIFPKVQHTELAPMPSVVFPKDNPYSKEKEKLGKLLFFDPKLSASGQIACANCHSPEHGWADGNRVSFGHNRKTGKRNSPTILNVAFYKTLFWDGRAKSLEDQVLGPIVSPVEMAADIGKTVNKFKSIQEYKKLFSEAFDDKRVSVNNIAKAIATFERTITSRESRFDKFMKGDYKALTKAEIRGLHIFRTKGRCMNCHHGPLLTDNKFHNLGLTYYKRKYQDMGRYNVTKKKEDVGKFRTPGLRDLLHTKPYMHNGIFNLRGIINMYSAGMPRPKPKKGQENDPLFPVTSPLIKKLNLSKQEKADLIQFLGALSSNRVKRVFPYPPKIPE